MTEPDTRPPTASAAFRAWLDRARPGEEYIYYIGHLAADRERIRYVGGRLTSEPSPWLDDLGELVWATYRAQQVTLVQRRLGPGAFAYIAIKRKGSKAQPKSRRYGK